MWIYEGRGIVDLFFSFILVFGSICGVINGSLLKVTPFQFFSIGVPLL